MADQLGYKVVGTIKSVKGRCSAGHKEGDKIELSSHNTAGLCGFFYQDIFPTGLPLQYGGQYPCGDPDRVQLDCMDKYNAVTIELQRER